MGDACCPGDNERIPRGGGHDADVRVTGDEGDIVEEGIEAFHHLTRTDLRGGHGVIGKL